MLHFNNLGTMLLTGSFDGTLALWDTRTNQCVSLRLKSKCPSEKFSGERCRNDNVSTTLFRYRFVFVSIFLPRVCSCNRRRVGVLSGHEEEISHCLFNFDCSLLASCSFDKTARLWDPRAMGCVAVIAGHDEEVQYTHRQEHPIPTASRQPQAQSRNLT